MRRVGVATPETANGTGAEGIDDGPLRGWVAAHRAHGDRRFEDGDEARTPSQPIGLRTEHGR